MRLPDERLLGFARFVQRLHQQGPRGVVEADTLEAAVAARAQNPNLTSRRPQISPICPRTLAGATPREALLYI
jgi:hypothetical protein